MDVPLWESRADHSEYIKDLTGSQLLATLQRDWSYIMRRKPVIKEGDTFAYSKYEIDSDMCDDLYKGKALATTNPHPKGSTIPGHWYIYKKGTLIYDPPPQGEVWHYHLKFAFPLYGDLEDKLALKPTDPSGIYIVEGVSYKGEKRIKYKILLTDLSMETESPTVDKFSPLFIKQNFNSKLSRAQHFRRENICAKPNKWVARYNIDLPLNFRRYRNIFASSKIKGFMWLLVSHALPVNARSWGEHDILCTRCTTQPETIKHMAFSCTFAREIRSIVFKEWFFRSGDPQLADPHSFDLAFFQWEDSSTTTLLSKTLNAICTYHIWLARCQLTYRDSIPPPAAVIANAVWTEMERSLLARTKHLATKEKWWTTRLDASMVPANVAEENITGIQEESALIASYLPAWCVPDTLLQEANQIRDIRLPPVTDTDDFIAFNRPVETQTPTWRWRLSSCPCPNGSSDAISSISEEESSSLAEASGD
jgi:hypothetical protein